MNLINIADFLLQQINISKHDFLAIRGSSIKHSIGERLRPSVYDRSDEDGDFDDIQLKGTLGFSIDIDKSSLQKAVVDALKMYRSYFGASHRYMLIMTGKPNNEVDFYGLPECDAVSVENAVCISIVDTLLSNTLECLSVIEEALSAKDLEGMSWLDLGHDYTDIMWIWAWGELYTLEDGKHISGSTGKPINTHQSWIEGYDEMVDMLWEHGINAFDVAETSKFFSRGCYWGRYSRNANIVTFWDFRSKLPSQVSRDLIKEFDPDQILAFSDSDYAFREV